MPERSLNHDILNEVGDELPQPQAAQTPTVDVDSFNRVCGVDRKLVEEFLQLIRDNFRKADMAQFFLEQRTGLVNIAGVTNVRDVVSHLSSFLSPDIPEDRRRDQLSNAEEHLRRAIIEPYEIALNELFLRFNATYEKFKQDVLPVKDDDPRMRDAPTAMYIESILRQVGELSAEGRSAKARNLWDENWEQGIIALVEAYEKLSELHRQVESYLFIVEKKKAELQSKESASVALLEKYARLKMMRSVLLVLVIALTLWTIVSVAILFVRR